MSFNYRQNGQWQSPTVKKRENGAWVTVGGGGGGGGGGSGAVPARFNTTAPSRGAGDGATGADIVVPTDYSSLQNAHDAATAGDRIWIDQSQGPFTTSLVYSKSEITIDGWDPGSSSRAVLNAPNSSTPAITSSNTNIASGFSALPSDTSLASGESLTGNNGETVIAVNDASTISVGDVIHISENRHPFGDPASVSGEPTTELRYVSSVDTSTSPHTITVNYQILLPYPNNNATKVASLESEWACRDIRFHGLDIRGVNSNSHDPFEVRCTAEPWIDNCHSGQCDGDPIKVSWCMRPRIDNVRVYNSNHYGVSTFRGGAHCYYTNIDSENLNRYAVRFGANSDISITDMLVDGVYATNNANDGHSFKSHYGSFFCTWKNVESDVGTALCRMGTRHHTLDGFSCINDGTSNQDALTCTRVSTDVTIKNTTKPIDGFGTAEVFFFDYDHSSHNEHGDNLLFENIEIAQYGGKSASDLGNFQFDADGDIGSLTFRNVTYAGSALQRSDVTSWAGYDSSKIDNLTVE